MTFQVSMFEPRSDIHALACPKELADDHLHERTLFAARNEKQATFVLLEFLAEVDARRLYSDRGYASLFEYVHKALGYSESQASERVSAMRLLRKVPEVKAKIESQELTLTSAAKLAAFVRREELSREKTIEILESISGKSTREIERVLASEQREPVIRPDHFLSAGPGTTRVSFDADQEFMALFQELRDLQGNPDASLCERLKAALKTEIMRKKNFKSRPPANKPRPKAKTQNVSEEGTAHAAEAEEIAPVLRAEKGTKKLKIRSRFINASDKRAVADRSTRRCEYIAPNTKRRCECRFGLEFDHYPVPFAKGGASTLENLRHVCRDHNRSFAIEAYGTAKMVKFLK